MWTNAPRNMTRHVTMMHVTSQLEVPVPTRFEVGIYLLEVPHDTHPLVTHADPGV